MRVGRLAITAFILILAASAAAREAVPPGFVYLRDIAPGIAQDMRYASYDNFTGAPLSGYDAAECIVRRDLAAALARVEADLAPSGIGLKVYDCYRPTRAVAAMARWAQESPANGAADEPTRRFYPTLQKRDLFAGYIAAHSAHSTGTAVDLTLIRLPAQPPAPFDRAAHYAPCTAPAAARAPDNSIDMGTGFDCFDLKAHTADGSISPAQKHWRGVLVAAMRRQGFHNYFREWWHFSYGAKPQRAYNFPIERR